MKKKKRFVLPLRRLQMLFLWKSISARLPTELLHAQLYRPDVTQEALWGYQRCSAVNFFPLSNNTEDPPPPSHTVQLALTSLVSGDQYVQSYLGKQMVCHFLSAIVTCVQALNNWTEQGLSCSGSLFSTSKGGIHYWLKFCKQFTFICFII